MNNITSEMLELIAGATPTVNPCTCDVVAFDECENRIVAYMGLHETAGICSAMCNRMNKMQEWWDKRDGVSVFSGHPIVWQFQDSDDPIWFDPKKSGLPVWGVSFPGGDAHMHRMLVRAVDSKLATRVAMCRTAQFDNVLVAKGATVDSVLCYSNYDGCDHITTRGIMWYGGPGKADHDPVV